jgi:DNA-binding transcriptional LysR family regulator
MDINYDLYKTFYVVANCSTLTEASKQLMISQPAVTKAIKNLESQLNGTLFIRNKNGIKLTENGKKFYNYIVPAIKQMQDASKLFNNINKIESGEVKVGTSNTILKYYLMPHLKKYSKLFPNVNISIEESYTPTLINLVKNGALDIAIIYANDNDPKLEGLKVFKLQTLNYCFIGNKKYKKYSDKIISFKDLKKESLILNTINPIQTSMLNNSDEEEKYIAHINLASHSLVYEFVKEGFGIGLVIKEFIKDKLDNKNLYEIKIKEGFQPLNLILIINKNSFPTYATSQLINIVKNKEEN